MPDAVFCTICGAHSDTTGQSGDPQRRPQNYAAHPGEHVAYPAMFSTLFPHLGHGRLHEFRYAFAGALVAIVILVATGLIVAALLASIFLVPVLYLLYLYEAQVYRHEPGVVLGFTIGGGLLLGLIVSVVAEKVIFGSVKGGDAGSVVALAVLLPIVQLIFMSIPALLLRGRAPFTETVDGLVFGVAAGLGFSLTEGLVRFSSVFTSLGVQTGSANWLAVMISLAVLVPLLHGSAAGVIAASLWRKRAPGRARSLALGGLAVAVLLTVAFYLGAQLLQNAGASALVQLAWQFLPVAGLLVYIRHLLHHALLEEGADMGFRPAVCPHCHRHVVAAGFCPSCGVALSASPRSQLAVAGPVTTGGR